MDLYEASNIQLKRKLSEVTSSSTNESSTTGDIVINNIITKQEIDQIKVLKRNDVLNWDDYFMSVAYLSSMRSKDPSTQV